MYYGLTRQRNELYLNVNNMEFGKSEWSDVPQSEYKL